MTYSGRIGISDPELETDGLRFMTIKSSSLGGRGDVSLFVPPDVGALREAPLHEAPLREATDLPLVLLLHGVYGSHWNWPYLGGAHCTARELIEQGSITPVILAMPSDGLWGDGSSYVPHTGADYEKWIVEDVINAVVQTLGEVSVSSPVFIGGLSMGGYGALRLGAKYPQRFQGISGHSTVTRFEQMEQVLKRDGASYAIDATEDGSILYWMLEHRDCLPPLRFDCGVDDGLIEGNRELHQALERHGVPHTYQEFEGGHTWSYWRLHLRDTLCFFDRVLKGERA